MQLLLQGCKNNDRESQRLLYKHYYGYAMSICVRYCQSYNEAKEVVNDGFLKVFNKLEQHTTESSFKGWLRRIMINSAIDHYRKESKHNQHIMLGQDVLDLHEQHSVVDDLSYQELIGMVQQLSPAYRTVFNLYVIDGHTHEDISKMLGISEGTSKSNLMKARENLKKMIEKTIRSENYERHVG